ncbi:hypothetical protein EWM64_g2559 [Hericium alpestre]|uniref:Uncharacterized protein n=1 Tax=Hericium alpestre TaxID=135208 RepID=A0A4Z0A4Y9_9AGAM|nr:hypothetical protein EWM64_g2559 [Hericium alpestre]
MCWIPTRTNAVSRLAAMAAPAMPPGLDVTALHNAKVDQLKHWIKCANDDASSWRVLNWSGKKDVLKARLAEYYRLDLSAVPLPTLPAGPPMVTEHIRERQWDHLHALGWEWHETEVACLLNEVGCLASMHPEAAAVAPPAGIVLALSETICAWTGAAALAHSDAVAITVPQQPLTALSRTLAPLTLSAVEDGHAAPECTHIAPASTAPDRQHTTSLQHASVGASPCASSISRPVPSQSTSQADAVKMGRLPAQQAVLLPAHGHSKFEETGTTVAAATLTHKADMLKACEEEILSLESTEDLRDILEQVKNGRVQRMRDRYSPQPGRKANPNWKNVKVTVNRCERLYREFVGEFGADKARMFNFFSVEPRKQRRGLKGSGDLRPSRPIADAIPCMHVDIVK